MLEKRLRLRHYLIAEATVVPDGGGEGDAEYGQTVNINSTGIAVYLKKRLETGTHVTVAIEMDDDGERVKAGPYSATVMWDMAVGDHHTTGFKFDARLKSELISFMKSRLGKRVLKF